MPSSIKQIEFWFENCEYISIEGKYIGDFFVGELDRQIRRIAINSISDDTFVGKVHMSFHADANYEQMDSFGFKMFRPFDRLTEWQDITHIRIVYGDNSEEIFVINYDWDGGSVDGQNKYQQTKLNSYGDLYLVVGESLKIDEIFPNEYIENKGNRDITWHDYIREYKSDRETSGGGEAHGNQSAI